MCGGSNVFICLVWTVIKENLYNVKNALCSHESKCIRFLAVEIKIIWYASILYLK